MTFIHEVKRLLVLSDCLTLRLGRLSNESENLSDVKTSQLVESFPVLNIPEVVECVGCDLMWVVFSQFVLKSCIINFQVSREFKHPSIFPYSGNIYRIPDSRLNPASWNWNEFRLINYSGLCILAETLIHYNNLCYPTTTIHSNINIFPTVNNIKDTSNCLYYIELRYICYRIVRVI